MLLKFLNLGSGFPVENRLKPFFPFIARQPENTRHQGSVQPALLATQLISFNLLLTARRIGNILCPTPTINFALLGRIYLSKYLLFIASRLWETENECPGDGGTLKTNRISCPRLRLIVKGWFSSVCPLHNGWLSSLSAQVWSLISSIRHRQATPRVEEPGFPGLTWHGCLTFAGV